MHRIIPGILAVLVFASTNYAHALNLCARIDNATGEPREGAAIRFRSECKAGEASFGTAGDLMMIRQMRADIDTNSEAIDTEYQGGGPAHIGAEPVMRSRASSGCGLTVTAGNAYFEACNVHVRSGAGATWGAGTEFAGTVNELGNLIVGYDEAAGPGDKTGSHNLVVGPYHTYTSYGGFLAGNSNEAQGYYSSVSGGRNNKASSGTATSVSGGRNNTASADYSSVSAGEQNVASGDYASVSGGESNMAVDSHSSVSGGRDNVAGKDDCVYNPPSEFCGAFASVSGGDSNSAEGAGSSIAGGSSNDASGSYSTILGGSDNVASNTLSSVSGGDQNSATGLSSSILGGDGITTSSTHGIFPKSFATVAGASFPSP